MNAISQYMHVDRTHHETFHILVPRRRCQICPDNVVRVMADRSLGCQKRKRPRGGLDWRCTTHGRVGLQAKLD